jgi:dTDP-glucose 4,6-dehydratase
VLITNCSNNYGPYQFPEKLIPLVILRATRGETIPVYGQGLNVRDWLHVSDHCSALQTVLEHGVCGETYNIGGNNELTNIEVVHTLCDILDRTFPAKNGESYKSLIRFVQDRPGHDLRYAIDSSKIRTKLGWQPEWNLSSGFQQTVEWYLNNKSWWESILNGNYRLDRLGVGGK